MVTRDGHVGEGAEPRTVLSPVLSSECRPPRRRGAAGGGGRPSKSAALPAKPAAPAAGAGCRLRAVALTAAQREWLREIRDQLTRGD
jgi:hypothetical protein